MLNLISGTDLIVISSQNYGSGLVRTSEVMDQFARGGHRVFFFLKPLVGMTKKSTVYYSKESHKVTVVQPYLPYESDDMLIDLIKDFMKEEKIRQLTLWTDTSSTLPFVRGLKPKAMVYDKKFGSWSVIENVSDIVLDPMTSLETLFSHIEDLSSEPSSRLLINEPTDLIISARKNHPMASLKTNNVVASYS